MTAVPSVACTRTSRGRRHAVDANKPWSDDETAFEARVDGCSDAAPQFNQAAAFALVERPVGVGQCDELDRGRLAVGNAARE